MATWTSSFNSQPPSSQDHGLGYLRIQETRLEASKRFQTEHSVGNSSLGAGYSADDGRHNPGSARIYTGTSEPAELKAPDGTTVAQGPTGIVTALDGSTDWNRLWADGSGGAEILRYMSTDTPTDRWVAMSPRENVLMNGGFQVWQRGTSVSVLAASGEVYTADRWYVDVTGADSTVSQATPGYSGARTANCLDITVAAGTTQVVIGTRIEAANVRRLLNGGTTATLSARFRNNATGQSWTPTINVNDANATNNFAGGVGAVDTDAPGAVASNADATWEFRVDLSGANANGLEIEIILVPAAAPAGGSLQLGEVMLEMGTGRSLFVDKPFTEELQDCKRYYEKTFNYSVAPAQNAGTAGILTTLCSGSAAAWKGYTVTWLFEVEKVRATYNITAYNPLAANALWRNLTDAADSTQAVSTTGTVNATDTRGTKAVTLSNSVGLAGADQSDVLGVHLSCEADLI